MEAKFGTNLLYQPTNPRNDLTSFFVFGWGSFELLPPCPPVVSAVRCPGDTPGSSPLALPTHLLKCSMSILLPLSSSGFAGDVEDALPKSCCGLPRHPGTPPTSLHILGVLGPSASGMWLVPREGQKEGP